MNPDRRRILVYSAAAVSALGLPVLGAPRADSARSGADIDVHLELRAVQDRVEIRPGTSTAVWRYHSRLLRGDAGSLQPWAGGWLGAIIRVRSGQRVRIDLLNELREPSIIHWHGLHVPDDMDGHPRHAIGPGERYVYEFTVKNRAGSYWFHPHPHGKTGEQVYRGLAGLFLVSDDEEAALDLPAGAFDLPLVIQDRSFHDDRQLIYPARASGTGMMRGGMMGRGMMGPKVFDLTMGMMTWGINGEPFEMLEASREETAKLGTHEVWEFRNEGRGAMMGMVMPHSMHVHGVQFRVIGRQVSSRFAREYATVKAGLVDDGWKDTVLVMPGERVRVLVGFHDYTGLFLYHCHMLEHEDSGLMRNYRVEA